jgi:hypothetical protein
MIATPLLSNLPGDFSLLLHTKLHSPRCGAKKALKANQIIILTEAAFSRIVVMDRN